MKTIVLVRHAKSSWDQAGLSDMERPLNDRGKKDAPEMAARLKDRGISLDLLVSSPARRARRTARYFAETYHFSKEDIVVAEGLYGGGVEAFAEVVRGLSKRYDTVALFSHNPTITEFANSLTTVRIDDMPTCSVFAASADVEDWTGFMPAQKNFLFFDYPKNPLF